MNAPPEAIGAADLLRARALAAAVPDPEIPVVTIEDLGILRDVRFEGGRLVVELTPTYTGCPATQVITDDVRAALAGGGFANADVRMQLAPPWTTDWITAEGRRKLGQWGIAPPGAASQAVSAIRLVPRDAAARSAPGAGGTRTEPAASVPACPRCGSSDTETISQHGSTPCQALMRCRACREPFGYFKPY